MKHTAFDFLLEIGVEELPASYIEPALKELREKAGSELSARRVTYSSMEAYSTPRRLTILARQLAARQQDLEKEVVGPAAKVAYDEKGAPTKAAIGFARSQGVEVSCLAIKKTEKGDYVCAIVKEEGKPVAEVLSEFLPSLILSLFFPKTMVWVDPKVRFGRPIRWVVALLGDEVVPFEVAGLSSDRSTFGNRFLAPGPIRLKNPSEYLTKLEKAWVIADAAQRRMTVGKLVTDEASKRGGFVVEDDELVGIVSDLLEYPVPITGSFDKSFLELPRAVVVTAMREHQRYFAVQDGGGNLMPFFITLRNGGKEGGDNVRRGNERVLKARLDDARFYWEKDVSIGITRHKEMLKDVVWRESLGSVFDKSERLSELSQFVMEGWDKSLATTASRAGLLSKVDLVSEMVKDGKEFTTLQGIIGGEYAAKAGEEEGVALAIREHYLPGFAGDAVPSSLAGCAVGVADRLDEIAGSFIAGRVPTGSEDPYGVRRQANGLVRILIEKKLHFSLESGVKKAVELLAKKFQVGSGKKGAADGISGAVLSFLEQRLTFILSEMGVEQDVVNSVLSVDADDPFRSWLKAEALGRWKSNEEFSGVVTSFKRVSNILKTEEYAVPSAANLTEEVERVLFKRVQEASALISAAVSEGNYEGAITHLLSLKAPIDAFFEGVMVMDQDPALRDRRLGLLAFVRSEFLKLADFSRLMEPV